MFFKRKVRDFFKIGDSFYRKETISSIICDSPYFIIINLTDDNSVILTRGKAALVNIGDAEGVKNLHSMMLCLKDKTDENLSFIKEQTSIINHQLSRNN